MRTKHDFDHPDKLKDADAPAPKTLTNYEAYLSKEQRTRTKGFFMNDPQRLAVVKHAAGYQVQELKDILRINPTLKVYLEKQMSMEDKKLAIIR